MTPIDGATLLTTARSSAPRNLTFSSIRSTRSPGPRCGASLCATLLRQRVQELQGVLSVVPKAAVRQVRPADLAGQLVVLSLFTAAGRPELWVFLWLMPYMTIWRVFNRLRVIAEHGGMERSKDRRRTTHNVEQHALARFWFVPFHTGLHVAHHVDSGVPFRNLPEAARGSHRGRLPEPGDHLLELSESLAGFGSVLTG